MTTATAYAPTRNKKLLNWVAEIAALTKPARIEWCEGTAEEYERLCQLLVDNGTFTKLDEAKRPNSFYAKSRCRPATASAGPTRPATRPPTPPGRAW